MPFSAEAGQQPLDRRSKDKRSKTRKGVSMDLKHVFIIRRPATISRIILSVWIIALGSIGCALANASYADELPNVRTLSTRSEAHKGEAMHRRQRTKVVRQENHLVPILHVVPPCVDSFFPVLLRCVPRGYVVPPYDGAVLNALYGTPRQTHGPHPVLFSW
jgi:hypothetical protein